MENSNNVQNVFVPHEEPQMPASHLGIEFAQYIIASDLFNSEPDESKRTVLRLVLLTLAANMHPQRWDGNLGTCELQVRCGVDRHDFQWALGWLGERGIIQESKFLTDTSFKDGRVIEHNMFGIRGRSKEVMEDYFAGKRRIADADQQYRDIALAQAVFDQGKPEGTVSISALLADIDAATNYFQDVD